MNLMQYQEIIKQAIEAEQESYDFYKAVSDNTRNSYLKELFADLAKEELEHKEILENYLKEDVVAKLSFAEVKDDYQIAETVDKPKLSLDMRPADAIALAMKEEQKAMETYYRLAKASLDPEQKEVFNQLAEMEKGHKVKLEAVYTNMAYVEVW
ncbi:MAG: ferritin family protein [Bacillota bacterium]